MLQSTIVAIITYVVAAMQGTVSLASGRPVPKSDILFVLENALRPSNVALVHDAWGYRLMPVGEAIGTGQVDVRR